MSLQSSIVNRAFNALSLEIRAAPYPSRAPISSPSVAHDRLSLFLSFPYPLWCLRPLLPYLTPFSDIDSLSVPFSDSGVSPFARPPLSSLPSLPVSLLSSVCASFPPLPCPVSFSSAGSLSAPFSDSGVSPFHTPSPLLSPLPPFLQSLLPSPSMISLSASTCLSLSLSPFCPCLLSLIHSRLPHPFPLLSWTSFSLSATFVRPYPSLLPSSHRSGLVRPSPLLAPTSSLSRSLPASALAFATLPLPA
ncbi:hypothetical protein ACLOJK_009720 [Asimina triloba]